LRDKFSLLSTGSLRSRFLETLYGEVFYRLAYDWPVWARLKQRPPPDIWRTWLVLGGRGAGKTRTGAEWLKGVVHRDNHFPGHAGGRVALVGESYADARDVMVEGSSGLLSLYKKSDRPAWRATRRELVWPNGTIGQLFSSSDPEGLRGNQFGAAWCDELSKWQHLETAWDMLQFCLRLGDYPRQVVTTTPKPLALLKRLLEDPMTVTTRSATYENRDHLAAGFLAYVTDIYAGTRLGRQELDGEIIEDTEHALWHRALIEQCRTKTAPVLNRIVIAVDPPAGSGAGSAACGIVAVGRSADGNCHVLADRTLQKISPSMWAAKVVALYHELEADLIVAEVNQGGDMVETVIRTIDPVVPVRSVHASRGKWLRAEPVALLYERGMVRHAGVFPELEDQMCAFGPDGLSTGASPDRLDALVWAITVLALSRRGEPRVRSA